MLQVKLFLLTQLLIHYTFTAYLMIDAALPGLRTEYDLFFCNLTVFSIAGRTGRDDQWADASLAFLFDQR